MTHSKWKAVLRRNVIEGIYAQRKLAGDPNIIAKDDPEFLEFVVRQGKTAEERLLELGEEALLEETKREAWKGFYRSR